MKRISREIRRFRRRGHAPTFLDIGCGDGPHVFGALKAGVSRATGVDLSVLRLIKMLGIVKQHIPNHSDNVEAVVADMTQTLPFQDGSKDIVFSTGVFHHLLPDQAENALNEVRRVVKPGGRAVIGFDADWKRPGLRELLADPEGVTKDGIFERDGEHVWRNSDVLRLLKKRFAGWKLKIRVQTTRLRRHTPNQRTGKMGSYTFVGKTIWLTATRKQN